MISSKLFAIAALCACSCAAAQTRPVARFTLGKETTIVDGPLNPDGTVDYLKEMNDRLGAGVLPEENAAIPVLEATTSAAGRTTRPELFKALSIPQIPDQDTLNYSLGAKDGIEVDRQSIVELEKILEQYPWKASDHPQSAAWLTGQQRALALLEEACSRKKIFIPRLGADGSNQLWMAFPPLGEFRTAAGVLTARAMKRGGEGDLAGALADLRRVRILGHFAASGDQLISILIEKAIDRVAVRAYRGLLTIPGLTVAQVSQIQKELGPQPDFRRISDATVRAEQLFALGQIMSCIRGDAGNPFQMHATMDKSVAIDMGNLAEANWDIVMKASNDAVKRLQEGTTLPRSERLRQLAKVEESYSKAKVPFPFSQPYESKTRQIVEAFLKRQEGESIEAFSRRIGEWMGGMDPKESEGLLNLSTRDAAEFATASLAGSLAQYRAVHGEYPATLAELGAPVPQDPFADAPLHYRKEAAGYVSWSVGVNGVDDRGSKDDISFNTEKVAK
jgi:hypothetical protein